LHLVGILFPHINDDARSKSHQNMAVLPAPEHDAPSRWDKDSQILIWKLVTDEY